MARRSHKRKHLPTKKTCPNVYPFPIAPFYMILNSKSSIPISKPYHKPKTKKGRHRYSKYLPGVQYFLHICFVLTIKKVRRSQSTLLEARSQV